MTHKQNKTFCMSGRVIFGILCQLLTKKGSPTCYISTFCNNNSRFTQICTVLFNVYFKYLPSISTSSWLSVFSLSTCTSLAPEADLLPPIVSISSMKIIHGALSLAILNILFTYKIQCVNESILNGEM